ncbi:BgTH12-07664 [Blumeria graminis f. sp. triticale]|uniref:BgTH12-07664 n=1 Tax=Blumeria graminis f. sp. triticale TaxID=1689686 RepID=A0A9W4CXP8_BLUGR|nr:BgTH12-07664 [Blumeria graminis f. sp. triticale]
MARTYTPLRSTRKRPSNQTTYVVPTLLLLTFFAVVSMLVNKLAPVQGEHLEFSTVPGYFLQDDPKTISHGFDFKNTNFGLINRAYDADADTSHPALLKTQWQRFEAEIMRLNSQSESTTRFSLLYMGRHGQGYHNLAESRYGTKAWDCYWSLQDGDEHGTWRDAELTSVGISQAESARDFWATMIEKEKIPVPQSYYVSPLIRCLQTAWYTFTGIDLPPERPFKPIIKELIRECIGVHTCDERSSRTIIEAKYSNWTIEEGFTENDELWSPTLRETDDAMDQRLRAALEDIFSHDNQTFISITAHSGMIASALRVLGHRDFSLDTGQAIPVLVRIDRVPGALPPVKKAAWFAPETCLEPPKPANLVKNEK